MTRGAVILAAPALLAGCAHVAMPPEARSVTVPQAYIYAPEGEGRATVAALLPADPAYAALSKAAAEAPTLGIAAARIDAARANLRGAKAARLPAIDLSSGVTQNRGSRASQPANPAFVQDTTSFQLGASASFDLDLFGRLRADQRAAAARFDAATADAAGVRLTLDADLANALIDWRDAQARLAVVERDRADAVELVRLTGARARAGIVPEFDRVRADSLAKAAEAQIPPLKGAQADALGRMVTLTGRAPADLLPLLAVRATASPLPDLAAGVPSALLRNRPDVRSAEARLAAARADVASAAAARFPRLTLTGTLGLLSVAFGNLFGGDAISGSLGAGIAGPLLDFGRVGATIDARQASAREAFETYRGAVFQALGETEGALGQYAAARERLAAIKVQLAVDEDALGLARERYRLGLADLLTVVDAQRAANATRAASEVARGNTARAAIVLFRALGGTP